MVPRENVSPPELPVLLKKKSSNQLFRKKKVPVKVPPETKPPKKTPSTTKNSKN
jgi:hypothetical protein